MVVLPIFDRAITYYLLIFYALCVDIAIIMLAYCLLSMSKCIELGQIDNLRPGARHHFFVHFDSPGRCDIRRLDLCLIGHAKRLPHMRP
jgi:hypothetical protein